MSASSDCNKMNARRGSKHEAWYASLVPRVAKRKDRNVARSSHGKFQTVAELRKNTREPRGSTAERDEPIDVLGIPCHVAQVIRNALRVSGMQASTWDAGWRKAA